MCRGHLEDQRFWRSGSAEQTIVLKQDGGKITGQRALSSLDHARAAWMERTSHFMCHARAAGLQRNG